MSIGKGSFMIGVLSPGKSWRTERAKMVEWPENSASVFFQLEDGTVFEIVPEGAALIAMEAMGVDFTEIEG